MKTIHGFEIQRLYKIEAGRYVVLVDRPEDGVGRYVVWLMGDDLKCSNGNYMMDRDKAIACFNRCVEFYESMRKAA